MMNPEGSEDAEELRARIKLLIERYGIKQRLVAERLNLREVSLSAFLTGKTRSLRPPVMERIRKLLRELETAGPLTGIHGERRVARTGLETVGNQDHDVP